MSSGVEAERRDELSRKRIQQELETNFLVEAAAGTGKTTCMVNRMVSLIETGACQIDRVVAVTFTRKAAAELRERFREELRRRLRASDDAADLHAGPKTRLAEALERSNEAFLGTIHSFCARLLRERPIEFGVDPAFVEIDASQDRELRETAWTDNINDLLAQNSPLIAELDELGVERSAIHLCFEQFINHQDIEHWPAPFLQELDFQQVRQQTVSYLEEMGSLLPLFPKERQRDKLMGRYEDILRLSERDWNQSANFYRLLEQFDTSHGAVQKAWHDKSVAKQQTIRWDTFRNQVAGPFLQQVCRLRYRTVLTFLKRAYGVYERLKESLCVLTFDDLLQRASCGLRDNSELRRYFQRRYTHLLVDEFQDTDPVQAELLLYLTASDLTESRWEHCCPKPGALFLVGDPKQSIYRFRRGDIVTYNEVKRIFQASGGEVLPLLKNFRSRHELTSWNNRVFAEIFPPQATRYAAAAEAMLVGREVDADVGVGGMQSAKEFLQTGIVHLSIPSELDTQQAIAFEAEAIARYIRHAIDSPMLLPRTDEELQQGRTPEVQPSDFLIIPYQKSRIGVYKAALEELRIPCDVTGRNAFVDSPELSSLLQCIGVIEDPHNPVHYLALLRGDLFGLSDQDLYEFKRCGGRFTFWVPRPEQLPSELGERLDEIVDRLKRYQAWVRRLPFGTALGRIVDDLGLLARAACGQDGDVAVGSLLKAIEKLRAHSHDFDSTSDVVTYLEQTLVQEETAGCTALSPNGNAVRVMNLHKAKGLEAPFVFLVDPSSVRRSQVDCHIDRSAPQPQGYLGITAKKGQYGRKEVATPENWKQLQAEEQRFLDAEMERLLYVATTRAESTLVISKWAGNSTWHPLYEYLEDAEELCHFSEMHTGRVAELRESDSAPAKDGHGRFRQRWEDSQTPSFAVAAAKTLGLRGRQRPKWEATGDYGYLWGSALHDLLEVYAKQPQASLVAIAAELAEEYELGQHRVEELVATVSAVGESPIWQRSRQSQQCFSELPLDTIEPRVGEPPLHVRGVLDLVFYEDDGWVIVDYKSDDIQSRQIPEAIDYYRGQLETYAKYWQQVVTQPVKELGLYFTRLDRYHAIL